MDPAARRLPGLDLLRAAAITLVMLTHASAFGLVGHDAWPVKFGWMGVDLFFALSGFLIAGQLLRPVARGERANLGRFYFRRLMRTLPAFLVVLAVYALAPAAREYPSLPPLWRLLSFTANLGAHPGLAFSHAWSLCVEEQFYLVFPLIVGVLALRPSARVVIATFLAILLFGMTLRGWLWIHEAAVTPFDLGSKPRSGVYMTLIYYPTWTRLDGLLAGVAAAAVRSFRPALWGRFAARANLFLALGLAGAIVSMALFRGQIGDFWACVFGFPLLSLSFALMVAAGAVPRSVIGRRAVPGAGALAAGAYSLYLSHKMLFGLLGPLFAKADPRLHALALPLAFVAAYAVGAALYWAVERPFLKMRDRLGARGPAAVAVEPAAA